MRQRAELLQAWDIAAVDVVDDQVPVGREEPQVLHQVLGKVSDRECQQAARMVADPDVVTLHVRFFARQFEASARDPHIAIRGVADPRFDAVEFAGLVVPAG